MEADGNTYTSSSAFVLYIPITLLVIDYVRKKHLVSGTFKNEN